MVVCGSGQEVEGRVKGVWFSEASGLLVSELLIEVMRFRPTGQG